MPIDNPTMPFYDVIRARRDVRGQFTGGPIPEPTLRRVLEAAHAAPSVGLTQPWDYILVPHTDTRTRFFQHVQQERAVFAATLDPEAARRFERIKIDGVLEASLGIVVTYDPDRGSPAVLGRHAIADAGLYSVCLSIQNLWLAATAEGLGVGWVSFYREEFLQELLDIPTTIRPVAWLCIGPVTHRESAPDLERQGWRQRRPLDTALHVNRWRQRETDPSPDAAPPTGVYRERPSPFAPPTREEPASAGGAAVRTNPETDAVSR